jgi:hypothetical protein
MNLEEVRRRALDAAMKVATSEKGRALLTNPKFQQAIGSAFQVRQVVQERVAQAKSAFADRFDLATEDDLKSMKARLDELEKKLREKRADVAAAKPAASKPASRTAGGGKSSSTN